MSTPSERRTVSAFQDGQLRLWTRGLFVHASAVVIGGKALLCLGHSGAGKSSIARLLADRLPVLADDTVFAGFDDSGACYIKEGKFRVRALAPEGITDMAERGCRAGPPLPPGDLARIYQARPVRLGRISPIKACRHLVGAAFEGDLQRALTAGALGHEQRLPFRYFDPSESRRLPAQRRWVLVRQIFGFAARLARQYPAWDLHFSLDPSTPELIIQHFLC
jgi:hypothetical protein